MEELFTILAIDDDPVILHSLKRILSREPYRIITTDDPRQALSFFEKQDISLVLLDLKMPGYDGMAVLDDITGAYPEVTVIMLTACGGVQQAVEAIKRGAADFLEKPCPPEVILQRINTYHTIWQSRENRTNADQGFSYDRLIGESAVIQKLKTIIVRVAVSDATVLIQGESGTGKELVARAIHHHSFRKQQPFVPVDCAAIGENILESELFGHEEGAFTGAHRATKGLLRSAENGTVFLDEIGELPITMQAKLLRTLQELEVRPVGGTRAYPVNIRIIAATNRNLEQELLAGTFRSDLFYRLATIQIDIPSLSRRNGDIHMLANYFLRQYSREADPMSISPEAVELLKHYRWPGNVRELENVIRRAMILKEGDEICADDLPATIVLNSTDPVHHTPRDDSLAAYELLALENALRKTNNNKRQAATLLGIGEATLYRKLKQFDLS
jgi:DNA-binding NtrC family response regulator